MLKCYTKSITMFGSIYAGSLMQSRTFCDGSTKKFDIIVIGGGSGGLACAKRSASYGAKVCVIEGARYGGTCVNVGCVPKKMMYNASHVKEVINEASNFGFNIDDENNPIFQWPVFKNYRDRYIKRLNVIYESGLDKLGIVRVQGMAAFESPNIVRVGSDTYEGKNIVIAVGGQPNSLGVPGDEYAITSDGFFELSTQPKRVAVIGAGYIAVELAGVFNGLGTETLLFVRGHCALRNFDSMLSSELDKSMKHAGINVVTKSIIKFISKESDGLFNVHLEDGRSIGGFDVVLKATGRQPMIESLSLEKARVKTNREGYIVVDDYQNTSTEGVYALGDVCGNVELTPMAIAAGRRLADRLYGGVPTAKADYTFVPTVVFSHPVMGTIGYTEDAAIAKFGSENIKIYNSSFVNLWYGSYYEGGPGDKPMSKYKLICYGPEEKVIGLHCIGMASDEILQGFSVAIKMGATKADFDRCIAIHPTAAEEMVTLAPWGLSGTSSMTK